MKVLTKKYVIFIFANCIFGFILYSVKNYLCCISSSTNHVNVEERSNLFFNEENQDIWIKNDQISKCNTATQVTHEKAKETMMQYCSSDKSMPKTLNELSKKLQQILLGHLIVNDEYKFIYCYTPKVACSNWKKVMKQLYGNFKEKEWVKMDHHCGFTFLNSFNESEIMRRLKTYFKFMFVRNPAERALSVYRNKFNEIESFYKVYGKKIMLMYHEESPMYKGKVQGDDVSFKDFLRYIANDVSAENMNEHYMPMTTLCQPCIVNYDFVGIYDNLIDDSEIVLKTIQAPDHIHFPSRQAWYKPTSDIFMQYYFSLISPKLLDEYLSKFILDFEMFSFPLPYFQNPYNRHCNDTLCFH